MSDSQSIRLLPRDLLGAWSVWLLASWALNLWLTGSSPLPTLRLALLAAVVAIGLVWPCWRLTIACPPYPTLATLMDWLFGLILFQVILVRVTVEYSLDKAIIIDAAVASHALLVAVIIDIGRRGDSRRRTLAMLAILIIFFGGAIVSFMLPQSWAAMSLVRMIWLATDWTVFMLPRRDAVPFGILAGAAIAVWIMIVPFLPRPIDTNDSQLPNPS